MYVCNKCGKSGYEKCGTIVEFKYPHHLHTTGAIEWTCCECLGHGYGTDGICIRYTEQREKDNMKTGYEWQQEYGVEMQDPDGFGERKKGMPRYGEKMTETQFQKGIIRCSCKWYDMPLFQAKMKLGS